MADDCCREPYAAGPSTECSGCGRGGPLVEPLTVKTMLTTPALARYAHRPYRFCLTSRCPIVYFADDGTAFATTDLREPVWQKEPPGRRTICYCFGENEADIAREIERTGRSEAVRRVRAHIAAGRCACEVRNPRGACCLGDLAAAMERLQPPREAER